jgi:hypothetical protein
METPEEDFEVECDTNYLPTKIAQDLKENSRIDRRTPFFV